MKQALGLARRGAGFTSPNPCVGAVLVRQGRVIGTGWHRRAGTPHAEVHAVDDARKRGERVAGATLYVTLEPCCTQGRTPACTELIIREKIKRVVVGATDPNPAHSGRAYSILRNNGIQVDEGLLAKEAKKLNQAFNHWILHRIPWVIGKIALSLDGRIAGRAGDDRWLTGPAARRYAHKLRGESDAILVGASTVRLDDPALTVRLSAFRSKVQPWRVVLTRSGRLPAKSQMFTDSLRARTIIYRNIPVEEVLRELGKKNVTCALIEGGGKLLSEAINEGLVNEIVFFLAPSVLGSKNKGIRIQTGLNSLNLLNPQYRRLGADIVCRACLGS